MPNTRKLSAISEAYEKLMTDAFHLICDVTDWKKPVDAVVPFESASFFYEAIIFVTGTVPTSERAEFGGFRLTAIGYAAGPHGNY